MFTGWKIPLLQSINHTEMMWGTHVGHVFHTNFTASLRGMSPLLIKLKARLFNSPPRNTHAKYNNVCWSKLIGLTFLFFLGNKITQSSESLTPPMILPPHLLAHHPFIFRTSALPSSHSYSPLLLLSYWSVASSIKHSLSLAWLLASKNIGTSLI